MKRIYLFIISIWNYIFVGAILMKWYIQYNIPMPGMGRVDSEIMVTYVFTRLFIAITATYYLHWSKVSTMPKKLHIPDRNDSEKVNFPTERESVYINAVW